MNPDKFSIAQMFSNSSNGKTSAGKVAGFVLIFVGCVMLLYTTFFVRDIGIVNALLFSASSVVTIGAGLILGKVFKPTKEHDTTGDNTEA